MTDTISALNTLASYLGPRDFDQINQSNLYTHQGIRQADIFAFFGGSILEGINVLAQAMNNQIAKHYIIIGGAGHTTPALVKEARKAFPNLTVPNNTTEAQLFNQILQDQYGLSADFLETKSTNCGNNISYLLDLIAAENLECQSIILCQDASMQRRMGATLAKQAPHIKAIHYAAYEVEFISQDETISLQPQNSLGMWSAQDYIRLLMGEIPRLQDKPDGYGPRGKNYLVHVDIPDQVQEAFDILLPTYGHLIREANPEFADK